MNVNLVEQIDKYIKEYIGFMNINKFPEYKLQTKEVSLDISEKQGYESVAETIYNVENGTHTLLISTNLELSKYVAFHEFTHMLDAEMYTYGDKMRYMGLSGFTEYHASQIELLQLLGTSSVDKVKSFSMSTVINAISGQKCVSQKLAEKQEHSISLFCRADFPANINTLKSAFGVLFNYFGLRSICEMYATNYKETICNEAFLKIVPSMQFIPLNRLMHNWLDTEQIDMSITLYAVIVMALIKEYKLI